MKSTQPLRGINLGGWLVVERWMTPSLFSGTNASNEYELSMLKEGQAKLHRHHQQFITETDIIWLKKQGIEIVRVPFGHWIFGDVSPYIGAIDRLDWLIETTAKYGIQVLLDLHGAPGAQNNYEHSGSGNRSKNMKWLHNYEAQTKTIEVLVQIAKRYRYNKNIWGIELLNEPSPGLTGWRLARFYRRAYKRISEVARPGTHIVFSDGYAPLLLANTFGLMKKQQFPVVMDCHFYYCFGPSNKKRNFDQHVKKTHQTGRLIRFLSLFQTVIVGEWSSMLPYPVSQENTAIFAKAQLSVFHSALAHFYWNYKTEAPGRWNFRDLSTGQSFSLEPREN